MSKIKALLIAEKKSLMDDIKAVYDIHQNDIIYNIDFVAQAGHLVELLKPNEMVAIEREGRASGIDLPIEPETLCGWKYKVSESKRNLYDNIKTKIQSKQYDVIIHAGDPDQEGQLLVDLVLKRTNASKYCDKILRFWSNDLTEEAILYALQNLQDNNDKFYTNLSNGALLRQRFDWRFGMNGSSVVREKLYSVYPGKHIHSSVGRVKIILVKIVADRIDEINNFVPRTTYGVRVEFDCDNYDNGNTSFYGNYFIDDNTLDNNGEETVKTEDEEYNNLEAGVVYFNTEAEARAFIDNLTNSASVKSIETKQLTTYAPPAYTLSNLQIDAAEKFNYNPDETLAILQGLYQNKWVSYPRTNCPLLSSKLNFAQLLNTAARIPELQPFYKKMNVDNAISQVKKHKKYVNDKEMMKHGHTGLCPTQKHPNLSLMTANEYNIYSLICKRFFAMFLPPLQQDKTTIVSEIIDKDNQKHTFKSIGKVLINKGFTELTGLNAKDNALPLLTEKQSLNVINLSVTNKTTVCPKPFTSGTIIKALENPVAFFTDENTKLLHKGMSIGEESTRSEILKTLINDDKYLEVRTSKKNSYLYPTKLGLLILSVVKDLEICQVDMTAHWKELIDIVKYGELSFEEANKQTQYSTAKLVSDVRASNYKVLSNVDFLPDSKRKNGREPICKCPCGGYILESEKSYFCSNYKEKNCRNSLFKKFMGASITKSDVRHLIENKESIKKNVSKKDGSKTWEQKLKYDFENHELTFIKKK